MKRPRRADSTGPARSGRAETRRALRRWPGPRSLSRVRFVTAVLAGLILAEAAVWGWYILRPDPGPSFMTDESCSHDGCHRRNAEDASIYVAVDGSQVQQEEPIAVAAGDPFEVDFHFTGMVGDPGRFTRVGMEIVVPDAPPWTVSAGTLAYPGEWSSSGLGATLWSPTWDRATNGDGATIADWVQSPDRPNAYYLSWARTVVAAPLGEEFILRNTVSDQGTNGGPDEDRDRDGIASHAGADALITVPSDAEPGLHQVEISGVGHTSEGKRAKVSATITVSVTRPLDLAPSVTERSVTGTEVYREFCTGCHGTTPNTSLLTKLNEGEAEVAEAIRKGSPGMSPFASAEGGPLSEDEIQAVVEYLMNQAELARVPGARPIPHDVAAATDCLACHGGDQLPQGHSSYSSDRCLSCHQQGPDWMKGPAIVHSLEGHRDCLRCHVPGSSIGVPVTHSGRTNDVCLVCHVPGPDIPPIPHALPPEPICLLCHGPDGKAPLPPSHEGRAEDVCVSACHRPASNPSPAP